MSVHQELENTLEALIDDNTLATLLTALSSVCDGKADHLRSNWQDEPSAKRWTSIAAKLDAAATWAFDRGM